MKVKHLFLTAFAILLSIACMAQKKIRISGRATDAKKVYLFDYGTKEPRMAAKVDKGEFSFVVPSNGDLPQIAYISVTEDMAANKSAIVLDGEDVNVDVDNDTRSGSKYNTILDEYNGYYNDYMKLKPQLYDDLNKKIPEKRSQIMKIYRENYSNIIGLYIIDTFMSVPLQKRFLEDKDFGTTLDNIDRKYENTVIVKDLRKKRYEIYVKTPGYDFIDLCLNDENGKKHWLKEWCGKNNYVLVDFWASWCGPCMGEMPYLLQNYAKYHERGFEIVGVSLDDSSVSWKNCIKKNNMTWPQLSDLKGWQSVVCGLYAVRSIPSNILVDPNGKVIAVNLRGEALTHMLQGIFDGNKQAAADEKIVRTYHNEEGIEVHENEDGVIFEVVEQNPRFPGGDSALMEWLANNLQYPTKALNNGVQGRVIVQFVINKDGMVVNPSVLRSVDPELDAEAIRVISAMPKWKPGMQRGKAVRVRFSLPITFRFDEEQNTNQTTTQN